MRSLLIITAAASIFLAINVRAVETRSAPAGFESLFDGKNLGGWWGTATQDPRGSFALAPAEFQKKHGASVTNINSHWTAQLGEIVSDGKGLFLTTDRNFSNFEMLLDCKPAKGAECGIYLRGFPRLTISSPPGREGAGCAELPRTRAMKARTDKWNRVRVIMVGSRVWAWLNGKLCVDGAMLENFYNGLIPVSPKGPIVLVSRGGQTSWKNLFVRQIESVEATKILRPSDPKGFASIFNGKDLAGWVGPTDCCRITNGTIVWRPGAGGTIYTDASYTNFIVRLEFKLPPGGNNGLAIRYPGTGMATYDGMCECQVLDDNYEKATGEKIDPRQAHGSAYGMVAAQRGYQHPIGEWNYEEVTVIGPTIKVELNGVRILDADLSMVTESVGDIPHAGKDRASGHFGLLGHNDPVMFRNLSIKSLN